MQGVKGGHLHYRKFQKSPSLQEIVEAFADECKEIAPRELRRWEEALKAYKRQFIESPLGRVSPKDRSLIKKILIAQYPNWEVISELSSRIRKLRRLIALAKRRPKRREDLSVEEARRYPLPQLCEDLGIELRRVGRYWRGLCPLHPDTHPSFTVYEEGRWYCFGCQKGGDTIGLVMKIKGLTFIETVRFLTGGAG